MSDERPVARFTFEYPRTDDGRPTVLEVDLMDVRAADGIQISYDFERDGWVVKQASTFSWEAGDKECDMDWQEVAFIQAWAREKTAPEWSKPNIKPSIRDFMGDPERHRSVLDGSEWAAFGPPGHRDIRCTFYHDFG